MTHTPASYAAACRDLDAYPHLPRAVREAAIRHLAYDYDDAAVMGFRREDLNVARMVNLAVAEASIDFLHKEAA